VGHHVIEDVDESMGHGQMRPNTEDVGVYHTLLNTADHWRTVAGLLQLVQ